ncbi:MAG: hypothetical protein WCT33_01605 [Patescibacteria group bacterium]
MTAQLKERVVRKITVFLIAVLMLVAESSIAQADQPDHTVIPRDRGIFIQLGKGKPGHLVTKEEVLPLVTPEFRTELDSVRAGNKRLVVVCCTDPTKYGILEIFKDDPRFKDIDFDAQNLDWDGGTNGAREASANQVLEYVGVDPFKVPIDYFHIRSQRIGDRYIHIYVDKLPTKSTERVVVERIVTERIVERPAPCVHPVHPTNSDKSYMLGFGAEWVTVSSGQPTLVPSVSFGIRSGRNFISGTLGYGSFGSEHLGSVEQSVEQKLFSLNMAHFYGNKPWFGLTARILYASECVETFGEYLQNGYGLYGGFAITKGHVLGYITPGLMFFDRLGTDRSVEPSIAAGVNYNFGM